MQKGAALNDLRIQNGVFSRRWNLLNLLRRFELDFLLNLMIIFLALVLPYFVSDNFCKVEIFSAEDRVENLEASVPFQATDAIFGRMVEMSMLLS